MVIKNKKTPTFKTHIPVACINGIYNLEKCSMATYLPIHRNNSISTLQEALLKYLFKV
jgi:hypothetical protein